jgi:hypothetical protein
MQAISTGWYAKPEIAAICRTAALLRAVSRGQKAVDLGGQPPYNTSYHLSVRYPARLSSRYRVLITHNRAKELA